MTNTAQPGVAGGQRTVGLIGGMSWASTATYYRLINEDVAARLGGLHSARVLIHSFDFHDIEALQQAGDWDAAGEALAQAGLGLRRAGAEALVICANTMHKVAAAVEAASGLPVLHVADATAKAVLATPARRVGLLGTRYTMEQAFIRDRLVANGLEVIIPADDERIVVNRVIYDELCQGQVVEASRQAYDHIIAALVARGAEAIILGCTELGLLVETAPVPLFDTTVLHARAAVDFAVGAAN
jgi:aspartate racemase